MNNKQWKLIKGLMIRWVNVVEEGEDMLSKIYPFIQNHSLSKEMIKDEELEKLQKINDMEFQNINHALINTIDKCQA